MRPQLRTNPATFDLAQLVRAHQVGVWRYLRFLGADPALADELTQETFLAVWRAGFTVRSDAETKGYLRTVARNFWRKRARATQRVAPPEDPDGLEGEYAAFARDDDGEGWLLALRACLEELTPRVRTALDRFYADSASREQIASELGMSDDGVKSLLRRSRETLRACIERRIER